MQQLAAAADSQKIASSGEESGDGASTGATVPSVVALSRLKMRPTFIQRPDPRAFRQSLRGLAHHLLRVGEEPRVAARHLAPSHLDRARLAVRQVGTPTDQQVLAHKEPVFLQHKRRAMRSLRDGLRRWGMGEVKKAADQREWGDVPPEVARALVECRRNRADTRLRFLNHGIFGPAF